MPVRRGFGSVSFVTFTGGFGHIEDPSDYDVGKLARVFEEDDQSARIQMRAGESNADGLTILLGGRT